MDNILSHNRGITSFNLYGNLLRVNFERNAHRGNYFKPRKLWQCLQILFLNIPEIAYDSE